MLKALTVSQSTIAARLPFRTLLTPAVSVVGASLIVRVRHFAATKRTKSQIPEGVTYEERVRYKLNKECTVQNHPLPAIRRLRHAIDLCTTKESWDSLLVIVRKFLVRYRLCASWRVVQTADTAVAD
jgi:hypothetical protein